MALISPALRWPGLRRRRAGFSLVEITLALAIVAFAFVAMLGLLTPGLGNFSDAMNTQTSAEIFQKVAAELQETDFDNVLAAKVATGGPGGQFYRLAYRFYDVQGEEVRLASASSETPSTEEQKRIVYSVRIRGSLPGKPDPATHSATYFTSLPGVDAPRFNPRDDTIVTVQVVLSRGREIESLVDTNTFLMNPTTASRAGVSFRTYSIILTRNGYPPQQ